MKKIINFLLFFIICGSTLSTQCMQDKAAEFIMTKVLPGGGLFTGTVIQAANKRGQYKIKQSQFQQKLDESEDIVNTLFFIVKNNPQEKNLERYVHQLPPHEQRVLHRLGCNAPAFQARMDYHHAKREAYSNAVHILRYEIRMATLMSWLPVVAGFVSKSIR
jgi:hypothetical protein